METRVTKDILTCSLASSNANFTTCIHHFFYIWVSSKHMHCSTLTWESSAWESSNRAFRMCIIKSKFHHMQAHASSKHMHCSALTCCSACESSKRACRMCIWPSAAASCRCSPSLVASSWKRTCSTRTSERKDYTFQRQFYEKPSVILSCPGTRTSCCLACRQTTPRGAAITAWSHRYAKWVCSRHNR